jgi:hypothetical protein
LVKSDWSELRDIVGEKMLARLKSDEKLTKMREASKRFNIVWEGDVTSVQIHSSVIIPIEDISVRHSPLSLSPLSSLLSPSPSDCFG